MIMSQSELVHLDLPIENNLFLKLPTKFIENWILNHGNGSLEIVESNLTFKPNVKPAFKSMDIFGLASVFHEFGVLTHYRTVCLAFSAAFVVPNSTYDFKLVPPKINKKLANQIFQLPSAPSNIQPTLSSKSLLWTKLDL